MTGTPMSKLNDDGESNTSESHPMCKTCFRIPLLGCATTQNHVIAGAVMNSTCAIHRRIMIGVRACV